MPGSPACFILIFLLCQLTEPAASGTLKKLVGALGGSVTFPLTHSVNQIDSIVWILNTTILVTIQPKMADRQDNIIVIQNHNKKRVNFPHGNYSLKLSKLNKSDSGTYRVEIYSSSLQGPFIQEYELHVYEHLPKPKVTMSLQNNKNGTCVTNLTCFMEQGGEDVTYSWKSLGQATNESHYGSILPVSWRLGEKDISFICMARNPISSNSSNPISAWKLCEGAADNLDSTIILNLLWVFLLLSVLALVPVILIMWRERRKGSIKKKKRMDIHQEVLNYYPPSGETSEYDTISNINKTIPEENSINMLYSTVQIPKKMEKPHPLPTSPDTPRLFAYENVI
ncbi:SLAM family member 7 [Rhinolophus ferrumequinum]|uniref:SLAM family member 7 n=1 Tax=Rhinolophus ferrumequinum TaxID=59479 RepID=A0A671FPD8_RHIFE|nr:SLAM family member 7 isoform X1 [Rhinolophus ferrumequinum]KAF6293768.1 SLAM family member 7 [Rhinolophus ferrumequinum]